MPKTLDLLIGFVLIMLIMSMGVTMITQFFVSIFNHAGGALRRGISDLLKLLDQGLSSNDSNALADYLLRDPLIARSFLGRPRLAQTVHRGELTKLLLEFSVRDLSKDSSARFCKFCSKKIWSKKSKVLDSLQLAVRASLKSDGIQSPNDTLRNIRSAALALEKSHPELANHERLDRAILQNATSDYLAKLNGWFDQTIDRVRDRFTLRARIWTVTAAVSIAVLLQLDAVVLINQLGADDKLREDLISDVVAHPEKYNPTDATKGTSYSAYDKPDNLQRFTDLGLHDLLVVKLFEVPKDEKDWLERWQRPSPNGRYYVLWSRIIGVLISAALISLGAPFWYELLKNLIRLRSLVATKDDAQRDERQTNQEPHPGHSAA